MPFLHLTLPPPDFESPDRLVEEIVAEYAETVPTEDPQPRDWAIADLGGGTMDLAGDSSGRCLFVELNAPKDLPRDAIRALTEFLTLLAAKRARVHISEVMVEYRGTGWI